MARYRGDDSVDALLAYATSIGMGTLFRSENVFWPTAPSPPLSCVDFIFGRNKIFRYLRWTKAVGDIRGVSHSNMCLARICQFLGEKETLSSHMKASMEGCRHGGDIDNHGKVVDWFYIRYFQLLDHMAFIKSHLEKQRPAGCQLQGGTRSNTVVVAEWTEVNVPWTLLRVHRTRAHTAGMNDEKCCQQQYLELLESSSTATALRCTYD